MNFIDYALPVILVIQLILIVYVNLTQLASHMGFDASSSYLQAMEMAKQGTLLIQNWQYTTSLGWDTPVLLAAPFYQLSGDIFFSYGLANIAFVALLLVIFRAVLSFFHWRVRTQRIVTIALLTPYLSVHYIIFNDLKYFSMMLTGIGSYTIRMCIFFFMMLISLKLIRGDGDLRSLLCYSAGFLISFFAGVSSGTYLLITILLPLLFAALLHMFRKNDWRQLFHLNFLYLLLATGMLLAGKKFCESVIGYGARDGGVPLIGMDYFWENLGSVFLGFFDLLGAIPQSIDTPVFSADGILFLLHLLFALFVFGILLRFMKRAPIVLAENRQSGILFSVVLLNFALFVLTYTTYGLPVFEARYLIPVFMVSLLTMGMLLEEVQLPSLSRSVLWITLVGVLALINITSYATYFSAEVDSAFLSELQEATTQDEVAITYLFGEDIKLAGRSLRVLDDQKIYKTFRLDNPAVVYHWGDAVHLDDITEYGGATNLVANKADFALLPPYLQAAYQYQKSVGAYDVYHSPSNPLDLVSGFPNDSGRYRDLPHTDGVRTERGAVQDDGSFLGTGEAGEILRGPHVKYDVTTLFPSKLDPIVQLREQELQAKMKGTYGLELSYRVEGEILPEGQVAGTLQLVQDTKEGERILAETELSAHAQTAVISAIAWEGTEKELEYRVIANEGSVIRIQHIDLIKY